MSVPKASSNTHLIKNPELQALNSRRLLSGKANIIGVDERMPRVRSKLGLSAVALVCGVIATMLSGLFENGSEGGMLGAKSFGHPWVWRYNIVQSTTGSIIRFDNLAADMAFWSITFLIALLFVERFVFKRSDSLLNNKRFVFSAVLLMPMGLLMGLIHELGHVLTGTALGGTLSYMQVGFLELYPKLAITSQFKLGSVIVTGLSTPAQQGLLLLAGSATASITALVIGVFLYTKEMKIRTRLSLKIIGVFGLLDMPFYMAFSSLGLRHWILLGENQPEPLIGARQLGIPDPILYLAVSIITFVSILLYSKWARISTLKIAIELKRKMKKGGA
jgi:hypothetical protein